MEQTRWQGCRLSFCSLARQPRTAAGSAVASATWNVQQAVTVRAAAALAIVWHQTASLHSQSETLTRLSYS